MSKPNWLVDKDYKPSEEKRAELRQTMKVWDFYDEFAWGGKKPRWLRSLQVLGVIAISVVILACIYYSTLILFLI